ncbi:unnamed protein product [Thlaspi arvense]|uniref:Jacalin-type lectin domain-containing protein n=1 Tax=Thlaspi arvense TaxID=13288 RepID=A0AAU9REM1_THLAR|nr:unnamed protein product [Thlaspi arvense]
MMEKLPAKGDAAGDDWGDTHHDDVTKIFVGGGREGIQHVSFEYVKDGIPKFGLIHKKSRGGFIQTFEINHRSGEFLESVEGSYNADGAIQGLQFFTNFRPSGVIGYDGAIKFSLKSNGKKIVGFHGSATDTELRSLGVYCLVICPTKMVALGAEGNIGEQWDDGGDHDSVSKVSVHGGYSGINCISFEYVKNGEKEESLVHGLRDEGFTQTVELDYLNGEQIISVSGYYDPDTTVIQALTFHTNKKTSDLMGHRKGSQFSIKCEDHYRLLGFHGSSGKNLHSLGAYAVQKRIRRLEAVGESSQGNLWDDGPDHRGIKSIHVFGRIDSLVGSIKFVYDKGSESVIGEHGDMGRTEAKEFALDEDEYITSVNVSYGIQGGCTVAITSLVFKTSKERSSEIFGKVSGESFTFESDGNAIVGFHGRSSDAALLAIGAYFAPPPHVAAATSTYAFNWKRITTKLRKSMENPATCFSGLGSMFCIL